ncbi:MAG: hypothetical protein JNM62_05125 [Flavobacteriales bacterium]|nr:hypothetical protein [Flavobacteriales bacterium]
MSTHALQKGLERLSFPALLATAAAGLLALAAVGQDDGQQYRVIDQAALGIADKHVHSWIDRSPDGRTLAASGTSASPLLILDANDLSVLRRIDIGDWKVGTRVTHSRNGKYLLLEAIEYLPYSPRGKNERRFAVVEHATGQLVVNDVKAYAAEINAEEETLYFVGKDGVQMLHIASGAIQKAPGLVREATALALSPDGRHIALAYDPAEEDLARIPSIRNDKKVIKAALKIGQVVHVHDLSSGAFLFSVQELFDRAFRLRYSTDGRELWIHAKPASHKSANPDVTLSYVDVADPGTGVMQRASFPSHAIYEPTFCANGDNTRFAIGSQKGWRLEVHLYDRTNGSMAGRFILDERLFSKLKEQGEKWSDQRVGFALLPDGKRMLMTMGSRLIEWTYAP